MQKIYNPHGQTYVSVDRELMLSYKEATDGQLLHQGINEAGSVSSFIAAGTSYSTHDEPMIPVYIFYSMFGFQRTADAFWAAADQMTRGFLIGATAGRTTLNGEGLQHEDGHSHLIAATNPAVVAYDPAFAFEIGHIVRDGLRRMYGEDSENIYYYLTMYNEPIDQPAEPDGLDVDGLLRGLYRYRPATTESDDPRPGAGQRVGDAGRLACPTAARRRLGRGGRRLVGDVVGRAAPRRADDRRCQPAHPRRPNRRRHS